MSEREKRTNKWRINLLFLTVQLPNTSTISAFDARVCVCKRDAGFVRYEDFVIKSMTESIRKCIFSIALALAHVNYGDGDVGGQH